MSFMLNLPMLSIININENPFNYAISLLILVSLVMILSWDILKSGIKNIIHKMPNMDSLVTIGVFSSFLYSLYGLIKIANGDNSYVHNLYFEASSTVLFFITIGKYIENINKDKTKEAIQNLMTITPQNATVIQDEKEIVVTIDEINKGNIVVCRPGEKIAVDGEIIYGSAHIDESFITGESISAKKIIGSKVIAGSLNLDGYIKYKAEKIGKDSTVSEIVKLVVEATNTKAPIAKLADKISSYFVPTIITIALLSFIVWYIISNDIKVSLNIFLSILVIACPCSLGLATPLAIVVGAGLCSKKGILVKNSEVLENSHKVKTIVFDKTGTLTNGTLSISKIYNYGYLDEIELIRLLASLEEKSDHPLAKAVLKYAKKLNINNLSVEDFEYIDGLGISGRVNSENILVGNQKLMKVNGINLSKRVDGDYENLLNDGNSIIFIAKNKEIIGLLGLKDTIRENIKEVIKTLKEMEIDVVMLTGDNENLAKIVAKEIGIENVIAGVSPKEKAQKIEKIRKNGITMMCGDGINDSISLVNADIGVSISNGTDIAIDSAQVVLMNSDISKILDLIYISKKTIVNIKQNLFFAFLYNIIMIPIAMGIFKFAGITLNPMIASFAMMLSSLTVVFNALRLKKCI